MSIMPPLVARVMAEIGDYSAKMKTVGAEATKVESDGGGALSRFGSVAKGAFVGAAASVAVIGAVAGIAISQFESTAKSASSLQRVIGGTAEDASRLRFAFGQAGLSTEAADVSMKKFTKSIETGDKSFKQYGISTKDLTGHLLPVNTTLENTAAAFKKLGPGVEASALAQKLFGKSGLDMLPFLLKGKEGIAALEKESDKYGMTLNQGNLNAIKKVTMAHREMDAAVKGLMVRIGAQLFPIVTTITTFMAATMVPIIISLSQWLGDHLGPAIGFVSDAIALFVGSFTGAGADVTHLSGGVMNAVINLGAAARAAFDAVGPIIKTIVSDVKGFVIGFLGLVAPVSASQAKFVDWGASVYRAVDGAYQAFKRIKDVVTSAVEGFIGFAKANPGPVLTTLGILAGVLAAHLLALAVIAGVGVVTSFLAWAASAITAAAATLLALDPLILVFAALALLAGGLVYAYQHFQIFRDVCDAVAGFVMGTLWPVLKTIAEVIATVVVGAVKVLIDVFKGIMTVVGPIINFLVDHWKLFAEIIIGVVLGPIGIAIALAATHFTMFKDIAVGVWNTVAAVVMGAWHIISDTISAAVAVIMAVWGGMVGAWNQTWAIISAVVRVGWAVVKGIFDIFAAFITAFVTGWFENFKAAWNLLWAVVKTIIQAGWAFVSTIFNAIVNFLKGPLSAALNFIKSVFDTVWKAIQTVVSFAWGILSSIFNTIANALRGPLSAAVNAIRSVFQSVWSAVQAAVSFAGAILGAVFGKIGDGIHFLGGVVNGIKGAFETAWGGVRDAVSGAWNFISGIFDKIDKAVGWVTGNVAKILGPLKDLKNIAGGLGSFLSGHATGGRIGPGELSVVGEHGPEVFMGSPGGGGRVFSSGQALPGTIGGGGVTISSNPTFHIYGANTDDVLAQVDKRMEAHNADLVRQMRMAGVAA